MTSPVLAVTAAVRAGSRDDLDAALAACIAPDIMLLTSVALHTQQARPDLAVVIYTWIVRQPRPEATFLLSDWLVAHNNACCLFRHADPAVLPELARRAMATGRDNVDALHNAACAFCAAGLADEAIEALRLAIELGYAHRHLLADDADLDLVRHRPEVRALLGVPATGAVEPTGLEEVRTRLDELRRADRHHNHILGPRLDEPRVAAVEARLGVRLPDEFRAFVMGIGDGSRGPMLYAPTVLYPVGADHEGHVRAVTDGLVQIGPASYLEPPGGVVWRETSAGERFSTGRTFLAWYAAAMDVRRAELVGTPAAPTEVPDWAPGWSAAQYAGFVAAVSDALDHRELTADLDHVDCGVVRAAGTSLGLVNLSRRCRDAEPDRWPTIVGQHLDALFPARPTDLETLLACLKMRVYPEDVVESTAAILWRPLAHGLVVAVTLDLPQRVETLSPRIRDRLGLDEDALFEHGLRNLRAEPRLEVRDTAGAVTVLGGPSYYAASHLLRLDDYVDADDAPLLVAVPERHTLIVARIADDPHHALRTVVTASHHAHASAEGPLTPHPYLRHRGELTRVMSGVRDNGRPWVAPPPPLVDVFERLEDA